jgi:hypothetical protein
MKNAVITGLLLALGSSLQARTLELPPRPVLAPKGSEFAKSVASLPLKQREERALAEVMAGNIPPFLRTLVPITIRSETDTVSYEVTPDYLAIGSDDDYLLMPMTPQTAQVIADRLNCTLPTSRMVDDIYASATIKLTPAPIPPSPEMTTVPVFLRHSDTVLAERTGKRLGVLVAGHKKDVVIANSVFQTRGKVSIYGWHKAGGVPIQPLYTGHTAAWVDYSHGVRLVHRQMTVNGEVKTVDEVLADPRLAPLLSVEGVMLRTRYALDESPASPRAASRGESTESLRLDQGVRVVIDRPDAISSKQVLLVFYAVPNGNTIEQTIGKARQPNDDWHFDLQHIGAQARFLRETINDCAVVVAYLENDLKSWPAWRRQNGDKGIPPILDAVKKRFDGLHTRIVLSGHSGGGSLIFGFLNTVPKIPDEVERIALLDANYAYDTERHKDKLASWLKASDQHYLAVLAYDDSVALLNGKPFVSASGGTWGRSHLMVADLEASFPFQRQRMAGMQRFSALDGRVRLFLKENPERAILHTIQVERNGFIASLLSGTKREEVGYTYYGDRAYARFIRAD